MMDFDVITPTLVVIDENDDPVCRSDNLMAQKTRPAYGYALMLWPVTIRWEISGGAFGGVTVRKPDAAQLAIA